MKKVIYFTLIAVIALSLTLSVNRLCDFAVNIYNSVVNSFDFSNHAYDSEKAEIYEQKLLSVLNEKGSTSVKEIFDFNFDRAYVIKENYIDGEGFAEKYQLDIDIKEVPESSHEVNRRIVFVDAKGKFIYEFRFIDCEKMSLLRDGMIIYPDTVVKKVASLSQSRNFMVVEFVVEDSDYLSKNIVDRFAISNQGTVL